MGLGDSKLFAEKKRRQQPTGHPRPKRHVVRKVRPAPHSRPYQYQPLSRYSYGSQCAGSQLAGYGQSPSSYPYSLLKPYSSYHTNLYNNFSSYPLSNYGSHPYAAPSQALMVPPSISQYPPVTMLPQIPESPLFASNQASPTFVPPSLSPSYPAMAPYSSRHAEYQPIHNNVGIIPLTPSGMTNRLQLDPSFYRGGNSGLFTDWTGGGQISPGFLGPPL